MSKPIKLTSDIFEDARKEFEEQLKSQSLKLFDGKVSFSKTYKWKNDEKATIIFTPEAYLKMLRLRYGLDYFPDALEAVSDDKLARELFESSLRGLFPTDYWSHKDGVVDSDYCEVKSQEEIIHELIKPLAEKYNDITKGYNKTFRIVYKRMGCSWSNLQTRYKNSNNLKTTPQKLTIVINNQDVFRKFKRCVRELLDETD